MLKPGYMLLSFSIVLAALFIHQHPRDSTSSWPSQHVNKAATQLSNSASTCMYMDQYQHVWLGTWDGLNRYDGSSIKVCKPDPFVKGTNESFNGMFHCHQKDVSGQVNQRKRDSQVAYLAILRLSLVATPPTGDISIDLSVFGNFSTA